ncbi:MAG TPA: YciI family protein [Pyrinomonadaceae bacterium]|nr:YciI family protein [Pyrinomonadaceae bacterium]
MKYMLLMSATKEVFEWYSKWPKEVLEKNIAFMRNFNKELKESGVLVGTAGLAFPDQAKIVRGGRNGEPITDGVFPESKEFLAGYWIIDVENADEAYKIAARASLAPAPDGTPDTMPIEVREVMSGPPDGCGD